MVCKHTPKSRSTKEGQPQRQMARAGEEPGYGEKHAFHAAAASPSGTTTKIARIQGWSVQR